MMAADVSVTLLQRELDRLKAQLEARSYEESDRQFAKVDTAHQNGGSGGGGDMDGRIRDLENGMTDVKVSLGKIETRLDHIERYMMTRGQLAVYALVGAIGMLSGGWWIVQQYLAPILKSLPH